MEKALDVPFDPLGALRRCRDEEGLAFLHSGRCDYGLGRYSVLAIRPRRFFSYQRGEAAIVERGGAERRIRGDLFRLLEGELKKRPAMDGTLPFQGGAIGYFGYEAGRLIEPGSLPPSTGANPDARFAFYDAGLMFDHETKATYLVANDECDATQLEALEALVKGGPPCELFEFRTCGPLKCNFAKEEFLAAVERVREYIRAGDVYQVNLSQRFEVAFEGSGQALFLCLAEANAAPYAAYLNFGDEQIVSSSPERFLQVRGDSVTTRPIKGTRPIGETEAETLENEAELARSEKDRSELLMIVDLERNDLGRVCVPGTVRVDGLFERERYATVIHQTANVSGQLEAGKRVLDCVQAMFPGGSITGAPKIRSMQIIDELERGERGVYTGAIGYLSDTGSADLNIAIRTMKIADGVLSFQVGGGIVWDSVPESEYEETLVKAKAMRRVLGIDD